MAAIVSLMILAALVLVAGAWSLWRRGAPRLQIVLMLLAGLVIAANVAILIVPFGDTAPLVRQAPPG